MIKAYTDIAQSKRLAEFLPLESADMEYLLEQWIDEKTGRHKEGYCEIPVVKVKDDSPLQPITHPCWSLDALMELLPEVVTVFDEETPDDEDGERDYTDYKLNILKENEEWIIFYEEDAHIALDHDWLIEEGGEHLIDAAYNTIIELHNKGLL